jgi:hypothetical protein
MDKKGRLFMKVAVTLVFCMMSVFPVTSCIRFLGSGEAVTEERTVSGFDSVSISSGMNLFIEQTGDTSLRIEADDNILPAIVAEVSNRKLVIGYKKILFGSIVTRNPVNIYLTVADLDEINLSSGANLISGFIATENLKIDAGSGANGEMVIDVTAFDSSLSSGSNLIISGTAKRQSVRVGSGAKYDGKELISNQANVHVSSGAVAILHVMESLDAVISSGATVRYYGQPQITSNITSGGKLESLSAN